MTIGNGKGSDCGCSGPVLIVGIGVCEALGEEVGPKFGGVELVVGLGVLVE